MALPIPPPYSNPVPNNPFYSPEVFTAQGAYYPMTVGSGLSVNPATAFLTSTGGGGGGVTSIAAGPGIAITGPTGNVTITNAGVLDLAAGSGISITELGGTYTITSTGGGAVPSATPLVEGIVYGCTRVGKFGSTAFGDSALLAGTAANDNVAIGRTSLCSLTTGDSNTAVGNEAMTASNGSYNTSVGFQSMNLATGTGNTAVGYVSLSGASGNCNVAIGSQSGATITTGTRNVAIGPDVNVASGTDSCQLAIGFSSSANWLTGDSTKAIKPGAGIIDCAGSCGTDGQVLVSNGLNAVCWGAPAAATPICLGTVFGCTLATGLCSTSLGHSALLSNTTGTGNTAVGKESMCLNTTGRSNTAVGRRTLRTNSTGCSNTAIGSSSLTFNTTGECNTGIGALSLTRNETGFWNTGLGVEALQCNLTGSCNTAAGWCALTRNDVGGGNSAMGHCSLYANLAGGCNTAVGGNSLYCSAGCYNTAIGYDSGCDLLTGNSNVAVGPRVVFPDPNGSCQLAIGFSATENWLTGNSTKAIQPGAGIIDCAASCGTANYVLTSQGNAVEWKPVNSVLAVPIYGSFFDITPLVAGTAGSGQPVALGQIAGANGISIQNTSEIHFSVDGTYNVQFSLQFVDTNASADIVEVWVAKNGLPMIYTNSHITLDGAGEAGLLTANIVDNFLATDYIQIYWGSVASTITLETLFSSVGGPESPNAIVTVVPVGA